jgi:RNA polymerase sigma-70 factor (ECF subfamily)
MVCVTNRPRVTHSYRVLYSIHVETVEDAHLVREIAAMRPGEARDAEAELYRRLAPRVRLYGLRHLRNSAAADDLTQQVLLIALEGLRAGRLREPEKLASFVLGTCRIVVLDLRRGTQRRERLLDQFQSDLPIAASPAAPELDREHLTRCLQALAERERSVIVLTFYDEQTSAAAAGLLGVSEANVRVIRHRALGRLRQCMGGRT